MTDTTNDAPVTVEQMEMQAHRLDRIREDNDKPTLTDRAVLHETADMLRRLAALASAPAVKLDRDFTARRIKELMDEGDGFWRACSGCQEGEDGYVSEKDYPFDPLFRCQPGGGCSECGGIGVLWDDGHGNDDITGDEDPASAPAEQHADFAGYLHTHEKALPEWNAHPLTDDDVRAGWKQEPLFKQPGPTQDAYMAACRALHWSTAQLRAHGIEPDAIAPNAPHYPPEDHAFLSALAGGGLPLDDALDRLQLVFPDAPADAIACGVQAVAAALQRQVGSNTMALVIAAREFWDVHNDLSPESNALDTALEPFAATVPYANDPAVDATTLD